MAFSAKLLGEDEHVIATTRTHWKAMIVPGLILLVLAGGGGLLATVIPDGSLQGPLRIAIGVVALVVFAIWVLKPSLDWYFATYTLTNRRLITRRGVLNRTGRDIPLMRINDVSYEHGLVDRLLRCGTLVIQSASDGGQVVLRDIPRVERIHLQMSDLLFGGPDGGPGDGVLDGEDPPPGLPADRRDDRRRADEPRHETLFSSDDDR